MFSGRINIHELDKANKNPSVLFELIANTAQPPNKYMSTPKQVLDGGKITAMKLRIFGVTIVLLSF